MDKKTLPILIVLVLVVVFYWPILEFLGFVEEPAEKPQPVSVVDTAEAGGIAADTMMVSAPVKDTPPAAVASVPDQTEVDTISVDTVVVETNAYTATLISRGGGAVSMLLKDYSYRDGMPVEMIPEAVAATPEAAFAGGTFSTSKLHFVSSLAPGTYRADRQPLELKYTFVNEAGGELVKRYVFYPDKHHYDLHIEVNNTASFGFERKYSLIWNNPLGVAEPDPKTDYDAMEAVAMMSGSREKLDDYEDDRLNQSLTGYTSWAGLRNKYFAAVMIPTGREADAVFARGYKEKVVTPDGKLEERHITVGMDLPFANVANIADSFTVFVGPLDYTMMSDYDVDLEDMLDIGTTPFVGWIIKPFAIAVIWLLPKMYSVIPNYGLVIILFALLVKIVTLPLSMKSFRSMQAMKELQPNIEQLKEKHKKNPQALNQEMMKLYKKHGVNPMSGCLPMLPQMPLFIAMFSVFRSTILLRDAPFVWFITDLSQGATGLTDPYIILVVLMIVAQFASQKLTMPQQQQQKALLYVMPLFMGFLFYKFAAGLVLYWACFSLFSLLDYVLFKRKAIVTTTSA